jgi:hypothetical protein
VKRVSPQELHTLKVGELGLDPDTVDLTSPEALANAVRRAAGLLCPCAPASLVRAVLGPLRGLAHEQSGLRNEVEDTVDALTAHGDLIEHREIAASADDQKPRTLLYAAPPAFVVRSSGAILLLGVAPDGISPLPDEIGALVQHVGHVRRLSAIEDGAERLRRFGLVQLIDTDWIRSPKPEGPQPFLAAHDRRLDAAGPCGHLEDVELLVDRNPLAPYRRRWHPLKDQTGRFVARRPQAYGAALWCYLAVEAGIPKKLLDLPQGEAPGYDEAWRLQCAIQAAAGEPQLIRVQDGPQQSRIAEVFFPLPSWVRRRWDAIGEPIPRRGCLFAYRLPVGEVAEELELLQKMLWTRAA